MKIAPSILNADFGNLNKEIDEVKDVIDYLHFDVMDGHFVPNISVGIPVLESLKKHYPKMIFDTHLMISDPINYIKQFSIAGSDIITFHVEANSNILDTIDEIHKYGKKAGISIKPGTSVDVIKDYLDKVELVLVMSVEPGFGGQSFMPNSLDKIKLLKELKEQNNYHYEIEVDGGINDKTIDLVARAGIEVVVLGSYVFKNDNHKEAILKLNKGM